MAYATNFAILVPHIVLSACSNSDGTSTVLTPAYCFSLSLKNVGNSATTDMHKSRMKTHLSITGLSDDNCINKEIIVIFLLRIKSKVKLLTFSSILPAFTVAKLYGSSPRAIDTAK